MSIDILAVLRLSVGVIFIGAVDQSCAIRRTFAAGIAGIPKSFRHGASMAASVLVILAECWIAAAHLIGAQLRVAAPLTIALLLLFLVAVATRLWRGVGGNCHCFGQDEPVTPLTVARLVALIAGEAVLAGVALSDDPVLIARLYPPFHLQNVYAATIWLLLFYACIAWLPRMSQVAALINFTMRRTT